MKFILNRKAFAFVISMLVLFCLTNIALYATDKNAHIQDVCCASINIDVSVTPDCCVLITIDDPYCNASLHLYQRLKPDGTYETLSMQTGGTTTSFKICPNPGETFVSYRVRITADWDTTQSACFTSFYAKTEKIGTIDLSCCGPCPDMSSWLTVKAVKDNSYNSLLTFEKSINSPFNL